MVTSRPMVSRYLPPKWLADPGLGPLSFLMTDTQSNGPPPVNEVIIRELLSG